MFLSIAKKRFVSEGHFGDRLSVLLTRRFQNRIVRHLVQPFQQIQRHRFFFFLEKSDESFSRKNVDRSILRRNAKDFSLRSA